MPPILQGAQLGALLLSGLLGSRGSGQNTDPSQVFQALFQQGQTTFGNALQPGRTAQVQAGIARGASIGQDISGALGRVGGASTGVGRIARSIGTSAGSTLAAEAEANFRQQVVELSRQNALSLTGPQVGFQESQRGGTENFLDFLARAISTGQLPEQLASIFNPQNNRPAA